MSTMLVDYPSSDPDTDVDTSSSPKGPKNSSCKRKQPTSDEDLKDAAQPLQLGLVPSKLAGFLPPLKKHKSTSNTDGNGLPPLPDSFRDLYATTVRTSTVDEPTLHHGRQRGTAHVEGNWPTHVYLEWHPSLTEIGILESLISNIASTDINAEIHSFLRSDLNVSQPLHISLSAPLVLKTEQRTDYLEMIRQVIRSRHAVGPIRVTFKTPLWSSNRDSTRWFLTLPLCKPEANSLNRLLHACNLVADRFKLTRLYLKGKPAYNSDKRSAASWTDPPDLSSHFHVSIAWSLAEPVEKDVLGDELASRDNAALLQRLNEMSVTFDTVKVKIGNVITAIDLTGVEQDEVKPWLGG